MVREGPAAGVLRQLQLERYKVGQLLDQQSQPLEESERPSSSSRLFFNFVASVALVPAHSSTMRVSILVLLAAICCCLALDTFPEDALQTEREYRKGISSDAGIGEQGSEQDLPIHSRPKRTLLLKKKLLGAGLLGFGLGIAKGYKAGHYTAPEVHHVYLSPPPSPPAIKYIEYVEKPVFVERIVESHGHGSRGAQKDPLPSYGVW